MNLEYLRSRVVTRAHIPGSRLLALAVLWLVLASGCSDSRANRESEGVQVDPAALLVPFSGVNGQIEAGGPFAGVEFHNSRPVPSRISFYYPVANSIDLSPGYWRRADSEPMTVSLSVDGRTNDLGRSPFQYEWAPYRTEFVRDSLETTVGFTYRFAEDLPIFVMELNVQNTSDSTKTYALDTSLWTGIRTSHTYRQINSHSPIELTQSGALAWQFEDAEADSAVVFVLNAGMAPEEASFLDSDRPEAVFHYVRELAPGESMTIVQLVGSTSVDDLHDVVTRARVGWEKSVDSYEQRVTEYVFGSGMATGDPSFERTYRLARALLQANYHHLEGDRLPMPCPAEYNFYFTHDVLLTDLGAVRSDPKRVRDDLHYLVNLAADGLTLPHARYWKDGVYVTEDAADDNWNHAWFVILAASYLRHSGDEETVRRVLPMIDRSLGRFLTKQSGGLMYSTRPDWWDIGNVNAARAYLTALAIRALESSVYLDEQLGRTSATTTDRLSQATDMRQALVDSLWDDDAGYLMSMLDEQQQDTHYYSGSLVAVMFDLLDDDRANRLVETAERVLLDEQLGIRNAMPADFHLLTEQYKFNGPEVGAPFVYMNGGIWSQGPAWYAQALAYTGQVEKAHDTLMRYLSIDGVMDSPNGQPAFYEYRQSDPASAQYGKVDKPTFLWAGGWFIHVGYSLLGLRENAWNLSFRPPLPVKMGNPEYDIVVGGTPATVSWSGTGDFLKHIKFDGRSVHTSIVTGPVGTVDLVRGNPTSPYLAEATAIVSEVTYDDSKKVLSIRLTGVESQAFEVVLVSPVRMINEETVGASIKEITRTESDGSRAFIAHLSAVMEASDVEIHASFTAADR